jgi:hypothetical protein
VNPASPTGILRPRFPRDPTNQPGLVFPQSPGIILETFGHALLVVAAHLSLFLIHLPPTNLHSMLTVFSSQALVGIVYG